MSWRRVVRQSQSVRYRPERSLERSAAIVVSVAVALEEPSREGKLLLWSNCEPILTSQPAISTKTTNFPRQQRLYHLRPPFEL
jgi:hypothetical protein